jgi:plastocyanin
VFHFNPKNHSVVQSAFADPCGPKDGGARSQFFPVAANSSVDGRPTFTVNVTTLDPEWFYCAQAARTPASHCGAGMVFSINCPTDPSAQNSFENFKKAALAVGASLSAAALAGSATPTEAPQASLTGANGAAVTVPPIVDATLVTVPITLDSSSIWTTTYTSFLNSPAATPVAAAGAVHTVVVGGPGKLLFSPDHIIANPRDQIVFQFNVKNHSVVQSAFASPCSPLNANNASAPQALRSGFHPVGANDTDFPTWTVTVNDTTPSWFYCEQTAPSSHCGAGMVFAVNAVDNTTRNFAAFQSLAEQLNGTGTSASAAPSGSAGTGDNTGAASSLRATGAGAVGVVFTLVAIAASLL